MIQRIQSLFLLGSFILTGVMFFFPLAELTDSAGQVYKFSYRGITAIFMAYPLAILLTVITLISLISIFLFKKRVIQMRLTVFNMVCMPSSIGLIYYSINSQTKELSAITEYNITCIFPLVALVLSYLALRNIRKDEALINSMDRIR